MEQKKNTAAQKKAANSNAAVSKADNKQLEELKKQLEELKKENEKLRKVFQTPQEAIEHFKRKSQITANIEKLEKAEEKLTEIIDGLESVEELDNAEGITLEINGGYNHRLTIRNTLIIKEVCKAVIIKVQEKTKVLYNELMTM